MESSDSPQTIVLPPAAVQETVASVLCNHGASRQEAQVQAQALLEGDLRGQHSHGVRRVLVLAERLKNGVTSSGRQPLLTWRGSARLHVDGQDGLGPVVAHYALDALLPAAHSSGVALASIANSGHIGMMAPYVERIANEGFIGIVLTTSEALVAPWGGTRAMVGTNPVGIGVPTKEAPLVVDMSTAAVSAGKILDFAARGEQIPLGWAVDENGRQTTDSTEASRGAIAPFGGPKGYALGLGLEALVGMISGSSFGREVHGTLDTELRSTKGDVLIAVPAPKDPKIIEALTSYLEQLRREGPEGHPVLIPGDRARALREERMRDGVPLDKRLWNQITDLSTTS